MTSSPERWRHRAVITWTVIGVGILLWGALQLIGDALAVLLPPLIIAGLVAVVAEPAVRTLERRGARRSFGVAAVAVTLAAAVALPTLLAAPGLLTQGERLISSAPQISSQVETWANTQLDALPGSTPSRVDLSLDRVEETLQDWAGGGMANMVLTGMSTIGSWAVTAGLTLVLGPVLGLYLLASWPRLSSGVWPLIPARHRQRVRTVSSDVADRLGRYVRGQLLLALYVGVVGGLALALLGVPFWGPVAVIAGATNLVPMIGPIVGTVVGALVALTVGGGLSQAIAVTVAFIIIQQLESSVLQPLVQGRAVRLPAVVVLLAVLAGGYQYGIAGMVLAIPVVAATTTVIGAWIGSREPTDDDPADAAAA